MKHLFIVSNVLNAIHDSSLVSGNPVPFDDPSRIPTFPGTPPLVLQAQNSELRELLNFDILPCIAKQVLRFCCIELPSELGYLELSYMGDPDNCNTKDPIRQRRIN